MAKYFSRILRLLLFWIAAWAAALALLILIRKVGGRPTVDWQPDGSELLWLWSYASALFGLSFFLATWITESRLFRSQPFGLVILAKTFVILIAFFLFLLARAELSVLVGDLTRTEAFSDSLALLQRPETAVFLLYIGLTSIAFGFLRQMSRMVGPRVLINLLLGKYHRPRSEDRVFMFLDMESSTTIAERLGHEGFSRMIQECFRDLADSAIRREVEIYQYVGDEAILTWRPEIGLRDGNCLAVFFEFEKSLHRRKQFYEKHFGVVPRFKAGVNLGAVTVAEVGVVKREISYLSDVLNTAARLEAMCRRKEARLLISQAVKDQLSDVEDEYQFDSIGELQLRGKQEQIAVYRVTKLDADG